MDRNIIDKTKILVDDMNIEESVSELESDITKTIENNNEKVKEVQKELEKIINERKEASSKIELGDVIKTIEEELPAVVVTTTVRPTDANIEFVDINNANQENLFDPKIIIDAISTSTTVEPVASSTFAKVDAAVVTTRKHELDEIDRNSEGIDDVTSISSTTQVRMFTSASSIHFIILEFGSCIRFVMSLFDCVRFCLFSFMLRL